MTQDGAAAATPGAGEALREESGTATGPAVNWPVPQGVGPRAISQWSIVQRLSADEWKLMMNALPGRVGARAHDPLEVGVHTDLETPHRLTQRPGDPQPTRQEHPAGVGRPPADRRPAAAPDAHREQPVPVSRKHDVGLQVAADDDECAKQGWEQRHGRHP